MLVISGDHAEKCELSSHIRGNTVSRVGGRFGTFFGIFVGVVSRAIFLIGFHLGTLGASNLEVCGYLFVIQSIWGWILGPAAGGARVRVPGSGRPSRPCFFSRIRPHWSWRREFLRFSGILAILCRQTRDYLKIIRLSRRYVRRTKSDGLPEIFWRSTESERESGGLVSQRVGFQFGGPAG